MVSVNIKLLSYIGEDRYNCRSWNIERNYYLFGKTLSEVKNNNWASHCHKFDIEIVKNNRIQKFIQDKGEIYTQEEFDSHKESVNNNLGAEGYSVNISSQ